MEFPRGECSCLQRGDGNKPAFKPRAVGFCGNVTSWCCIYPRTRVKLNSAKLEIIVCSELSKQCNCSDVWIVIDSVMKPHMGSSLSFVTIMSQ